MKTVTSVEDGHLQPHYAVSLPFELAPGRYVTVRWKAASGQSISFNFAEGHDFSNKVLFHYNPRLGSNVVVRNSKDGAWGPEERDGDMPFAVGVPSEVKLVVRPDFYECFGNGVKHVEYKHRFPKELAKFFFISGECEIYSVAFGEEATEQVAAELKEDLTVPYSKPCDIFSGRKIYISGTPNADADKFRAILTAGDDYAFSFAARMNQNVVVMNSKEGGEWQAKEESAEFPFKHGQFFNILIEVETDKFKVSVNDQPFVEFQHRILPLSNITGLLVDHDIKLCCVKVH